MNNKRVLKRRQLMYFLPVTDRNTAQGRDVETIVGVINSLLLPE